MMKKRSKVRSPVEWRKILDGLEISGLTQTEYAQQVGCHPSAFGWWRKRLKEMGDVEAQESAPSAFIELRTAEAGKTNAVAPQALRIEGRGGVVASFESLPAAEYLAHLLRAE